jgi:hypothetical protein
MFRPLITKVGPKPFEAFFRTSFRSTPLKSTLLLAPAAKRFATHQSIARPFVPTQSINWPKLVGQATIVGATAFGLNLFLNRETREGGIPPVEQAYLHDTFKYVGAGLGITALAARGLHVSGWSTRFMMANPWLALLGGLGLSIGNYHQAVEDVN